MPKHDTNKTDHQTPGHTNQRPPLPLQPHDDNLTETESIISSRQGHHLHKTSRHHADKYEKYKYNGLRINGHSKHRSSGLGYESASILSSDLETTTFLESDDDASSRITSTTGRHTNMSSAVDRTTLGWLSLFQKFHTNLLKATIINEFFICFKQIAVDRRDVVVTGCPRCPEHLHSAVLQIAQCPLIL